MRQEDNQPTGYGGKHEKEHRSGSHILGNFYEGISLRRHLVGKFFDSRVEPLRHKDATYAECDDAPFDARYTKHQSGYDYRHGET